MLLGRVAPVARGRGCGILDRKVRANHPRCCMPRGSFHRSQRQPLELAAQRKQPLEAPMQLPVLADAGGVEAALEEVGTTRLHFFVLLCVSLIWAGDAMEVMVLSYMGPAAACDFGFSATQQSLLSSMVFGGMVVGALAWGLAGDALGRRQTLLASAAVVVVAGLASAAAPNYWMLLLSRACVGFGLAAAPVAFTLMMELLPGSSRGRWGTLIELSWTAGTVVQASAAWALLNSSGWRPLLLVSVLPLALLLVLGRALPESPRYLLATRGDAPAAQAVLERLAASSGKQLLFAEPPAATTTHHHHHRQQEQVGLPDAPAGSSSTTTSNSSGAADDAEQQAWLLQRPGSPFAGASSSSKDLLPTGQSSPVDAAGQQPVQQLLQLQLRQLLAEARLAGRMLSRPPLAATAALVFSSWLGTAFVYYGLVQLAGELHIAADAGASAGPTCHGGVLQVPDGEFLAVLLTSAAEVPAVLLAAACVSVPWLGNRRSTAAMLLATSACLVPGMLAAAAGSSDVSDQQGWLATASAAGMIGARLFVMAAFTLLWVFTPELLPTHIRASGLGLSNACARLGALLSPFAAINLVASGAPAAAEGLFAAIALAAGGAVLLIDSKHDAGPMEGD